MATGEILCSLLSYSYHHDYDDHFEHNLGHHDHHLYDNLDQDGSQVGCFLQEEEPLPPSPLQQLAPLQQVSLITIHNHPYHDRGDGGHSGHVIRLT